MISPAPDTWNDRDLPILRGIVTALDKDRSHVGAQLGPIAAQAGLDIDTAYSAVVALQDDGLLVEVHTALGPLDSVRIRRVSGDARRLAGSWPTPEGQIDMLNAALQDIADDETQPEHRRTKAKAVLAGFGDAGRQFLIEVAAAVVARQTGG